MAPDAMAPTEIGAGCRSIAARACRCTEAFMTDRIRQTVDEIFQHLATAGLTVATAESCTAGRLAVEFAKGEVAARHFLGGFVTCTKDAKTTLLNVPANLLAEES